MSRAVDQINNCAGGINTGLHPILLNKNEFAELTNFFVRGDSIFPKQGSTRIIDTPLSSAKSFGSYRDTLGVFRLVAFGSDVSLITHDVSPTTPADIPCTFGVPFVGSTKRPFIVQGGDFWYMADPDGGPLRRGNATSYQTAGIDPPVSAVTIAQGAAGVMTAANYRVVVTFYNSATQNESDYSPVSNTLALAANKKIDISSIPVSSNPQVDKVRVWLSPPDQINTYLLIDTIDNGTTTLTIDATVEDLQEILPNTNHTPPSNIVALAPFDDRLFVTDGRLLYASLYNKYETFNIIEDVQPILSADGHLCNVLHTWGSRLVAGKTSYVVYFTSTGTGDYIPTILSDKYGVRSPHAMKSVESILMWFDGVRFQRSDSGVTPKDISGIRIKYYLDRIPANKLDDLVAVIAPKDNLYVVTIPQPGGRIQLAYNYKEDAWSVFDFANDPIFLEEGFIGDSDRKIYCLTSDGYIDNIFDPDSSTDGGNAITYSFKTRGIKVTATPVERNWLHQLSILCTNIGKTATLTVLENGISTVIDTASAYLYNAYNEWKTFKLSTFQRTKGASFFQVAFSYTGALPKTFKITSLLFNIITRPHLQQSNIPEDAS
jgi:hypothetical protein